MSDPALPPEVVLARRLARYSRIKYDIECRAEELLSEYVRKAVEERDAKALARILILLGKSEIAPHSKEEAIKALGRLGNKSDLPGH